MSANGEFSFDLRRVTERERVRVDVFDTRTGFHPCGADVGPSLSQLQEVHAGWFAVAGRLRVTVHGNPSKEAIVSLEKTVFQSVDGQRTRPSRTLRFRIPLNHVMAGWPRNPAIPVEAAG